MKSFRFRLHSLHRGPQDLVLALGPCLLHFPANHGAHKSHNGDSCSGISATYTFNMIDESISHLK